MRRVQGLVGAAGATISVLAFASECRAAHPCSAKGPYVVITAPHPGPANVDVPAVVERLRQELASRGLELCAGAPPAPAAPALATVRLEATASAAQGESVSLDIEVRDEVTAKRVGREIDLSGTPRDGRAVVVALAADELLRASWAELSLARVPPPRVPVPRALRSTLAPSSTGPSRVAFAVQGAGEGWSGGLSFLGADAELAWRLSPRWSVFAAGGVRAALDVSAPDGSASARAATLRIGPSLLLSDPARAPFLSWTAAVAGYLLQVDGDATPPAHAASRAAGAVAFQTGPSVRIPIVDSGVSLVAGASFAVAGRGPALLDGSRRVAALSGVAGMASLGIGTP